MYRCAIKNRREYKGAFMEHWKTRTLYLLWWRKGSYEIHMERRDGWQKQSNRLKMVCVSVLWMGISKAKLSLLVKKWMCKQKCQLHDRYDISIERYMWIREGLLSRKHQQASIDVRIYFWVWGQTDRDDGCILKKKKKLKL